MKPVSRAISDPQTGQCEVDGDRASTTNTTVTADDDAVWGIEYEADVGGSSPSRHQSPGSK